MGEIWKILVVKVRFQCGVMHRCACMVKVNGILNFDGVFVQEIEFYKHK